MNNQVRAKLIESIAELQQQYPEWRLGQLIAEFGPLITDN